MDTTDGIRRLTPLGEHIEQLIARSHGDGKKRVTRGDLAKAADKVIDSMSVDRSYVTRWLTSREYHDWTKGSSKSAPVPLEVLDAWADLFGLTGLARRFFIYLGAVSQLRSQQAIDIIMQRDREHLQMLRTLGNKLDVSQKRVEALEKRVANSERVFGTTKRAIDDAFGSG